MQRQKSLQVGSHKLEYSKLFPPWIKPHHPVAQNSAKEAGIDITIFKAHSTWSASVSPTKKTWHYNEGNIGDGRLEYSFITNKSIKKSGVGTAILAAKGQPLSRK